MPKLLSILLLTFVAGIIARGQQSIFRTYTVSDGLVNNSVRRIFQDSKGFLWIATWEGLSKYDGNRFTNFTESNGLSHNLVNDIVELPSGDMYVAMNNGAVDLIRNDRIIQQRVLSKIVINRFDFGETGRLLALTDSAGIAEISGNRVKYLNKSDGTSCYGLVSVNDSLIAAATDSLPIHIYDKKFRTWSVVSTKINGGVSSCVFRDLQNRLWIGTTKGLRLVSLDYIKRKIKLLNPPAPFDNPLLSQGYVNCMFQERNGTIWVGTAEGLINISKEGQLRRFTENDGLPSRFVNNIFHDREDNLWIGTNLGLAKIIAPAATAVPQLFEGQPHHASIIKRISSQELLIASNPFFYRYNFQTGKIEKILHLQMDRNFTYVTNSSPAIFIYGNELYDYDTKSNRLNAACKISNRLNFAAISSATTADQHTIFIPIVNAIAICVNGHCFIDSTFKMRINNILADQRGYVWLGTWDDGLYRAKYDALNKKWTQIVHLTELPDNHIRSLFQDRQGNIWVGTRYNGLVRLSENASALVESFPMNQRKGLSSNWIANMTEDAEGNMWVVTKSGIDKLIKTDQGFNLFNYSRIINFFPNVNLIEYAEVNRLFCSSPKGLFEIHDEQLEQNSPQQVYLTRVTLAGASKTDFTFHNPSEKVILPYSTNNALFEFTSPTYLNEKEILYSYRLNGSNDTAWSHPANSHSVQYASLKPGHYRFEVRMLGWNGAYGPTTSFLFTVKPPYWNTWWFYFLIVVVLLLAMYTLYRYRINHILRLQKVRNTIATDLHDDIGSTLTNISILSELSKKNLDERPVAEKYLQRITEESVATQQALDDIIWSVNTRNDNMQELQARMRRYAGELFEGENVKCEFSFDNTESSRLNMEQRRDVYLVFKECLNNIHKHASAKNIYIRITVTNGVLNMEIQDDGKGFDCAMTTHRNGLNNMKTRVEKWHGDLNIATSPANGTRISVTMPVKSSLLK